MVENSVPAAQERTRTMPAGEQDASLPQYRTISPLAVFALLLGIASPLALINPLLLIVPFVAAVTAWLALRSIANNPDILSGKGMAYVALFLAVLFIAYTPVRLWTRGQVLNSYARQLGDTFLKALQDGEIDKAHGISQIRSRSMNMRETMARTENDTYTDRDLEEFKNTPVIGRTLELDRKFSYTFLGFEPAPVGPTEDVMVMRYRIEPEPSTGKSPFDMYITATRRFDEHTGVSEWKMFNVSHTMPDSGQS